MKSKKGNIWKILIWIIIILLIIVIIYLYHNFIIKGKTNPDMNTQNNINHTNNNLQQNTQNLNEEKPPRPPE
jgi:flagellar basal body-associated protein FliL